MLQSTQAAAGMSGGIQRALAVMMIAMPQHRERKLERENSSN